MGNDLRLSAEVIIADILIIIYLLRGYAFLFVVLLEEPIMKILIGIMHPKHVYMFKNLIKIMANKGHEIRVIAVEKDITGSLLSKLHIPYTHIGTNPAAAWRKPVCSLMWTYSTLKIARKYNPDIFIGQALPHFAFVSALLKKPYIIFEDTESARLVQKFCFPLATKIATPNCYVDDLGSKQVRFNGYFELAYLHPNHFVPNPDIFAKLGLKKDEKYVFFRFVSWDALHDIGQRGFDQEMKIRLISLFEGEYKIFISSEAPLPDALKQYEVPESAKMQIHDILYYASMYVGESPTMTTESAVLGTPAICMSSWACTCGNFNELSKKYGLLYCFKDFKQVLETIEDLLKLPDIKGVWSQKRQKMLRDSLDVSGYMAELIERYNAK